MEVKNSQVFWDSIHKNFRKEDMKTDGWLEPFVSIITKCETPILDLGCGSGNDTLYFAEKGKKVIACDQSAVAIDNIQKNIPDVYETRCFNMLEGFEFADGSFDIICADLCLHYFREKDMKNILSEIKRMLTPNGHVFVRVNSINDVNYGAGEGEEVEPHLYRTRDGMLKRFFDEEDMYRFFSDFQIVFLEEQKMYRYQMEKMVYCICLKNDLQKERK